MRARLTRVIFFAQKQKTETYDTIIFLEKNGPCGCFRAASESETAKLVRASVARLKDEKRFPHFVAILFSRLDGGKRSPEDRDELYDEVERIVPDPKQWEVKNRSNGDFHISWTSANTYLLKTWS